MQEHNLQQTERYAIQICKYTQWSKAVVLEMIMAQSILACCNIFQDKYAIYICQLIKTRCCFADLVFEAHLAKKLFYTKKTENQDNP